MKLITAIIKPFKLDDAPSAVMRTRGSGTIVTEVKSNGRQSGNVETYRGAEYAIDFLTKLMIEGAIGGIRAGNGVDASAAPARPAPPHCEQSRCRTRRRSR